MILKVRFEVDKFSSYAAGSETTTSSLPRNVVCFHEVLNSRITLTTTVDRERGRSSAAGELKILFSKEHCSLVFVASSSKRATTNCCTSFFLGCCLLF